MSSSKHQTWQTDDEIFMRRDAFQQGKHDAYRDLSKYYHRKLFRSDIDTYCPDLSQTVRLAEKASEKKKYKAWAITINPGNYTDLRLFEREFCAPFHLAMQRKSSVEKFSFEVEAAPETKRLHLHGRLQFKKQKGRHPCDIARLIEYAIPEEIMEKMNTRHIVVKGIDEEVRWQDYMLKDSIMSFDTYNSPFTIKTDLKIQIDDHLKKSEKKSKKTKINNLFLD